MSKAKIPQKKRKNKNSGLSRMQALNIEEQQNKSLFTGYDQYLTEGYAQKGRLMPTFESLRLP